MWNCPNCGAPNSSRFCSKCGTPMPVSSNYNQQGNNQQSNYQQSNYQQSNNQQNYNQQSNYQQSNNQQNYNQQNYNQQEYNQAYDATPVTPSAEVTEPAKARKFNILLVIIPVVIIIGAVVAFFLFSGNAKSPAQAEEQKPAQTETVKENTETKAEEKTSTDTKQTTSYANKEKSDSTKVNPVIADFVEENKGDLDDGMTMEAVGNGIVFTYKDASLDELDEDGIDMIKEMFQEEVDSLLEEGKKEVPQLKWIEMKFLNSKDEVMFTLTAGK